MSHQTRKEEVGSETKYLSVKGNDWNGSDRIAIVTSTEKDGVHQVSLTIVIHDDTDYCNCSTL